jgi:AraC family transcriptional regulator
MEVLSTQVPAATRPGAPAAPAAASTPRSAACEAMRVAWRELRAGSEVRLERETLALIVPLAGAALRASLGDPAGRTREAALAEPEVALVPARTRHVLGAERGGALLLVDLDLPRWIESARASLGHAPEIRECYVGEDPFVRGMATRLSESLQAERTPPADWLQAIAADVGLHLATRYGRPPESSAYSGLAPHRLQRVLALIEERLGEAVQVRDLAAAVHMSPYHFARMFKQSTGQPPHLYITWQRMDRAKELLAQSALPLSEIASRVGYQTQAHFTGVFHARVGITPRAYRVRCREGVRRSPSAAAPSPA